MKFWYTAFTIVAMLWFGACAPVTPPAVAIDAVNDTVASSDGAGRLPGDVTPADAEGDATVASDGGVVGDTSVTEDASQGNVDSGASQATDSGRGSGVDSAGASADGESKP